MSCSFNMERVITKRHYEYLNALPPIKRFAEKFRLETEALEIEIRDEDRIIGWFNFDEDESDAPVFTDCVVSPEDKLVIEQPRQFGTDTSVDRGHTLLDYESILKNGLIFYEKKIDDELRLSPDAPYLVAMKDTVQTVKNFTARISRVLEQKIAESDVTLRNKLREMQRIIDKVPYNPSDSFQEAIQAIWIIHFLAPLAENAWYSISLGRFDQYMTPFYQKALADGISCEEIKAILFNFYQLLNSYADGACLLNVGPAYNDFSMLILECQKEFAMPAPILGARIGANTSAEAWSKLIDEKLFSMGQPTFYGETSCTHALCEKGLSLAEASNFSNNSCMGISIAGDEFNSMWGCSWRIPAILEAAVNNGKLLGIQSDFQVPGIQTPQNIDDVWKNFETCARHMFNICVAAYEKKAALSERNEPDCFVSLLTPGCIEKRCDRISGAKYHNVTVECFGMINASDGIYALDQLVFQRKKYALDEMINAIRNNFIGYEAILNDISGCAKFGENSYADEYAVQIAEVLQRVIRSHQHDNLYYSPSLHTLTSNVFAGKEWGATFDGRHAGAPFAKNAGASNEARKPDPTSMILSCSKLPQRQFFGGQPIDVNFQTDLVRNRKEAIQTLIQIYLDRGGLQFQVNSLSSKLLREASEHPEEHPNLVVRVGGYSMLFSDVPKTAQLEFIDRFEREGF